MTDTARAFPVTPPSPVTSPRFPMAAEIDLALRFVDVEASVTSLRSDLEAKLSVVQRDVLFGAQLVTAVQQSMHERFDALGVKVDEVLRLLRLPNGADHG